MDTIGEHVHIDSAVDETIKGTAIEGMSCFHSQSFTTLTVLCTLYIQGMIGIILIDRDIQIKSSKSKKHKNNKIAKELSVEFIEKLQDAKAMYQLIMSGDSGELAATSSDEFIFEIIRRLFVQTCGVTKKIDGHKFRSFVQKQSLLNVNLLLTDVDSMYQRHVRAMGPMNSGDFIDLLVDILKKNTDDCRSIVQKLYQIANA